jgi:hypothetical protein
MERARRIIEGGARGSSIDRLVAVARLVRVAFRGQLAAAASLEVQGHDP